MGADFKAWGMRFLQRLGAGKLMSGGKWPDDLKILALMRKLEDSALSYCEKVCSMDGGIKNSGTRNKQHVDVTHDAGLIGKEIELMTIEKDYSRTYPGTISTWIMGRSGRVTRSRVCWNVCASQLLHTSSSQC